jgi:hypothetical protein
MLIWPLGILATLGVAAAGEAAWPPPEPRVFGRPLARAAAVLAVGSVVLHGAHFAWKTRYRSGWVRNPGQAESLAIARRVAEAARLTCRTAYAIGDHSGVLHATGLRPAIPMQGLFLGAFPASVVKRLPAELERARPDLVYYDSWHAEFFERRYPTVRARIDAWLARDYTPRDERDSFGGQWWERREAARAPCPLPSRFEPPAR